MKNVYFSDNTANSENGTLRFSQIPDIEGEKIKGFLWEDNGGLTCNPLADAFDYGSSGTGEADRESCDIIAGTLGSSAAIDELAEQNEIDVSEIKGEWEAFSVQQTSDDIIVIVGSDKRGTIYGIYDFCEKIGVSPWKWWADAEPTHADELYVDLPDGGYTEGASSVKYRGIFPNDEYLLNTWSNGDIAADMNTDKYEKIYELILRLKLNTLWPAMHHYSTAFHNIEGAAELAGKYGVVMGSSHAEPLLRNNLGELYAFQQDWISKNPDKPLTCKNSYGNNITDDDGHTVAYIWTDKDNSGNIVYNKEFLTDYWRESVRKYGKYENIYTLGMRGVHDGSFNTNMSSYTEALTEVIAAQKQILTEELCTGENRMYDSIDDVPTAFIAYKDILKYYNTEGHLGIPESTTIMYTDDNFGYMRQNAGEYERGKSGRAGVYYHLSYYGAPRSYLWLSSTQPGLIREELTRAYDTGADKIWIANIGDLKPAEKEIEYYARLARNISDVRQTDIADIYKAEAMRDYNMTEADAEKYADMMDEFYELANSKRPDFYREDDAAHGLNLATDVYGDEAQMYLNRYNAVLEKAESLYSGLESGKQDAFFELALYPIRCSRNMAACYIQTERANIYAAQNRGTASERYAAEARAAAEQIDNDILHYNSIENGKWNGIAALNVEFGDDAVIYYKDCDPIVATDPEITMLTELDYTAAAIAVDGNITDTPAIELSTYDTYSKFFDVVNQGYGSFDYTVSVNNEAVLLSKTTGTSYGSDRVYVGLDSSKAADDTDAVITVERMLNGAVIDTKEILVNISVPDTSYMDGTYYVEANGIVSIEAEHYSNSVKNGDYEWKIENDFGRSGDSVKAYPNTAENLLSKSTNSAELEALKSKAAQLEYDIYFTEAGTYTLDIYRMPTLDERNAVMRCAAAIDDNTPVSVGGTNSCTNSASKTDTWAKGVLANTEKLSTAITVPSKGKHTLKLYTVSPAFVVDKMVLRTNDTYSYFGAPESYNSVYNSVKTGLPSYTEQAPDESGITKLFEPAAVTGIIQNDNGILTVPVYAVSNITSAVAAVVEYNNDGSMASCDFEKITLTNGTATAELSVSDAAENYAVIIFDNFTELHPVAPYVEYGNIRSGAADSAIGVKTELDGYINKKSIVLVADAEITEDIDAGDIKYLRGETIERDSYKNIPIAADSSSRYYIRVGIDGESALDETVGMIPDNINETVPLFSEDFDEYSILPDVWNGTASGLSVESDSDNSYLKYASSGSTIGVWKALEPISCAGKTVTVETDLMFSEPWGGTRGNSQFSIGSSSPGFESDIIDYGISKKGHILAFEYKGGETLLVNNTEADIALIGSWMHVKAEIDFESRKIDLTLTNDRGIEENLYDLEFWSDEDINKIGSVYLRAAKPNGTVSVDNFNIYEKAEPKYAISITAVDEAGNEISGASVTVADSSGAEIRPETDGEYAGKYMLGFGSYTISVSAPGYEPAEQTFELNAELETKDVVIGLQETQVQ